VANELICGLCGVNETSRRCVVVLLTNSFDQSQAGPVRPCSVSLAAQTRRATSTAIWPQTSSARISLKSAANILTMANRGYDVVVDVDQEVSIYPPPISNTTKECTADNPQGRPRPHRPARRPRIPQLQYTSSSPNLFSTSNIL
jgi:hypothetical protein